MIHSILWENLSSFHLTCLLVLILSQLWRFYSSRGKLWYAKTKSNLAILNSCPSIFKGNFSPSIYLGHKLLQSKFATFLPSMAEYVDFDFEEVTMPNGGHTNVAWPNNVKVKKNNSKRTNTLVLILPGVTGSAGDNYIKDLIHLLADEGYECCVYLPRFNCKEIVMPHNGHNDIVEDFKHALDYITKKRKNMKIFGLGHSYGANLMINYLGKHQEENRFIGVVSIANPLNFILSEIRVRNCLIEKAITKTLLRNINRSPKLLAEVERLGVDIDHLRTQTSMRGFDSQWSLKVYGHNSVTDLHWDISSIRRLKHVKLPIFMLSAEDDPIIDPRVITKNEIENDCPHVIYKTTPKGGHLGWIYGFFKLTRWYPKPTIEFINVVTDMKM